MKKILNDIADPKTCIPKEIISWMLELSDENESSEKIASEKSNYAVNVVNPIKIIA